MARSANMPLARSGGASRSSMEVFVMAHCFIMDFETGTAEGYDAVMVDMGLAGRLPEHALFHGAGAHGSGWRVVDVWETPEAFQAFAAEKIGPISGRHGFAPPRVTGFPV